jgi:hypothetical protein
MAAPTSDASRAFIENHPELLGENVPALLAGLAREDPDPATRIHQALLTLARSPAGVNGAYHSLRDAASLRASATAAIAARNTGDLQACALIEALVHNRPFAGALHMVLASLLDQPAGQLPDDWASQLQALAAQTDSADKDTALTQFTTELASITADSAVAGQLWHVLGLPDKH